MMNIVLIGYRCSGKTIVGRLLADHLKMNFLDTDKLIEERTGIPIPSYVSLCGWGEFRRVERSIVRQAAQTEKKVIATGGGIVTDPENIRDLRRNAWVVWLAARGPAIRERMVQAQKQGDLRPPLLGKDCLDEIESVLRERTPLYEKACDCCVWTDDHTPDMITRMILDILPRADIGCMGRSD